METWAFIVREAEIHGRLLSICFSSFWRVMGLEEFFCFVLLFDNKKCWHVPVFRVTISHYTDSSFLVENKSALLRLLHWVPLQVVKKSGLKTCISQMTPTPGGVMRSLPPTGRGSHFPWNSDPSFPYSSGSRKAYKCFLSDCAFRIFLKMDLCWIPTWIPQSVF